MLFNVDSPAMRNIAWKRRDWEGDHHSVRTPIQSRFGALGQRFRELAVQPPWTKHLSSGLALSLLYQSLAAAGTIGPITSGYGANGPFDFVVEEITSPLWPIQNVSIYRPEGASGPVPTVFFSHGFQGTEPLFYSGLLEHIASRGYAAVFSPYKTVDVSNEFRYLTLAAGFKAAVDAFPQYLDTTRVGFMGHSFGAGANPSMAYRGIVDEGWGANGAFMYSMAPWYSYDISQSQLENFPSDVKMLMQIFDDDRVNDHRMAIDIFENISIDKSEKDFVTVYTDDHPMGPLNADHFVPLGAAGSQLVDSLDYYGIFRLVDALADYTFTGNLDGKNVALGDGSPEQIDMGIWPDQVPAEPLTSDDSPEINYAQLEFLQPWTNILNPRVGQSTFCVAGDANCDEAVNFQDFVALQVGFGITSGAQRSDGDLDGDGDVDFQDFIVLQVHFGTGFGLGPQQSSNSVATSAMPEPGTACLALCGLAPLVFCRRAHRLASSRSRPLA